MLSNELTKDQKNFADANHNLIFSFLSDKDLPMDDYYDVVVFGYLRAVRQYLKRDDIRRRYTFDRIAYSKMADDLYSHQIKQLRPVREAATVSYDSAIYGEETLYVSETIPGDEYMQEKLEAKLLWEQLSRSLTHEQIRALRLRAEGYTDDEIAARRQREVSDVKSIFEDIQAAAFGFCLA